MIPRLARLVLAAAVALGAAGCDADPGRASDPEESLQVVAAFYPLQWLAERLVGADGAVTSLTPAGTEPHDLQVSPPARRVLETADVVLYLGSGFQPDVERALAARGDTGQSLDLLADGGVELLPAPAGVGDELGGAGDPHVWLDPVRMQTWASRVADALVTAEPGLADAVATRLAALRADLQALDEHMASATAACARRTLVTSHAAFGYLADRYDLEQVPIAGLDPADEPDPATLRQISGTARATGVTTVFVEEALPPALAETVATEVGARTDLLGVLEFDPAGAVGDGEDYLSVQRRNAAALRRGLDCR